MVGGKGRVVVPADVRDRAGLTTGTRLVMVDAPQGIVLLTQAQLRDRVRARHSGMRIDARGPGRRARDA